jgi:tetratricopeptide (TPR) repeat protein
MMDGQSKRALDAARKVAAQHNHAQLETPGFGFAHLLKTLPLLTMVRFGMWEQIIEQPTPGPDQPFGLAMFHFARGFALAAQGNLAAAQDELRQLEIAVAAPWLKKQKIFELNSLAQLAAISVAMLQGETASRRGDRSKAIGRFRQAVELEDALLYSEPPDWPVPPRQYLAAEYLKADRAEDAEAVFRADLKRHRGNGWSLFGLEQSLRMNGRTEEAKRTHALFVSAWKRADVQLAAPRF